ncbi:MAG TPA: guanylate kinase [Burkholderiales bacterium]|nr:guanylate kinase [Burkholderiales bacterium]
MNGNLFIVCAPSGAGKTSLVNALLEREPHIELSISYTTRIPREGEVHGREYHFVSRETFLAMATRGEFLESAEVHGNLYGTSQAWIDAKMREGRDIVLEIDWQGAQQVRRLVPSAIGIFVLPPSLDVLRRRLTARGQDSDDVIERRLANAREEIRHVGEFDYVIINQTFDVAVVDLVSIVRAARLQVTAQLARYQDLINAMK